MIVTKEALAHLGMPVVGTTVAVQGFGNVGSVAAQLLHREGCKVVAISDRSVAIHDKNGIDVDDAVAYVGKHRSLDGYGKGEVIFIGTDETWRWRDSTGDRLTARFWGQIVARFGLPHLLGNAKRTQLVLGSGGSLLGRPGTLEARLLDAKFEPVTLPEVAATLVNLDAKDPAARSRDILLRRVPGQPGEYRAALPNDVPGRHEVRVAGGAGLEEASLPFRVELPPRHELEEVGLASEALRAAAATSGGRFYREEDLHGLPDAVVRQTQPFVQRREILLWNPLAMAAFLLLITAEWLVRKFSNLS